MNLRNQQTETSLHPESEPQVHWLNTLMIKHTAADHVIASLNSDDLSLTLWARLLLPAARQIDYHILDMSHTDLWQGRDRRLWWHVVLVKAFWGLWNTSSSSSSSSSCWGCDAFSWDKTIKTFLLLNERTESEAKVSFLWTETNTRPHRPPQPINPCSLHGRR